MLAYDADSNITSRVTRKGDTISFAYDTMNRVCTKAIAGSATNCGAASGNPTVYYSYDMAGRVVAVNDNSTAMAAVSGSGASYGTTTTYDALNRPVGTGWTPVAAQTTPTASSVTFNHSYDLNNRRISQAANDNSWLNYPASASNTGNQVNSLNQYSCYGGAPSTCASGITPAYDGNGNLTNDGTYTYCYDTESRLTSILSAGTCASPATTVATYAYDAQERRKSKTVGGTATVYVTDADNREVLEYDGSSGATQRWYAYGQGSNQVLNQMNVAAGTRETLIPDIQGSIIGSLDSSGTLIKFGYWPYGESGLSSGTFRYTAVRFDAEGAKFYYDRARMYFPAWGRFIQPDPSSGSGTNLYAYTNNDPLNLVDPSGLAAEFINQGQVNEMQGQQLVGQLQTQAFNQNPVAYTAAVVGAPLVAGCFASGLCELGGAAGAGIAAEETGSVGAFSPINPGPLASDIANTFRSATYRGSILSEDTTLYRVIGNGGNPSGAFWTRTQPMGPLQSVIDLALDQSWGNTATTTVTRTFPAGTQIFEGAAAPQGGLVGGGSQIYIPGLVP